MRYFLLLILIAAATAANAATSPEENSSVVAEGLPNAGDLTPEQETEMEDIKNRTLAKVNQLIAPADIDKESAEMLKQRIELAETRLAEKKKAFGSGGGRSVGGKIPIFGGALNAEWDYIYDSSNRISDYTPPPSTLNIIDGSRDHLAGLNNRLQAINNKLSKYTCGAFDWQAQFKASFNKEALKQYVTNLTDGAIAAAPMALLANLSPTLYEIVKHLKAVAAMDLQSQKISCEAMEQTMISASGTALRGPGWSDCMKQNESAGLAAANRICQQRTNSPYDGIENQVGKIQSPFIDQRPLNVTDMITEGISGDQKYGSQETLNHLNDNVTKAKATYDSLPNPGGPPDASWTDQQKRQYEDRREAKDKLDQATSEAKAYKDSFDANNNTWNNTRAGLGQMFKGIVGNIIIRSNGVIEFGNQPLFALRIMRHQHAAQWTWRLQDDLLEHWNILVTAQTAGTAYSQDLLDDTYTHMWALLSESMEERWNSPGLDGRHVYQTRVPFTNLTIDKMAAAWAVYSEIDKTSGYANRFLNEEAPITDLLSQIGRYEIAYYYYNKYEAAAEALKKEALGFLTGGNNHLAEVYPVIERRLEDYRKDLLSEILSIEGPLREDVKKINSYRLPIHWGMPGSKPPTLTGQTSTPNIAAP
jgi:hypothetical protein